MRRWCLPVVYIFLFFFSLITSLPVFAEEKGNADSGNASLGSIVELLKEKKIISNDEAAAFLRQSDKSAVPAKDLKALLDLLREKGVISGTDADAFSPDLAKPSQPVAESAGSPQPADGKGLTSRKMLLPSEDKAFIARLKELWVKSGNRPAEFDEVFVDSKDVEEIIGRMRVMAVITPEEADDLEKEYRETYLSGAVTTILENKEKDYLDRIRKNTAWEIDDKIHNMFKTEWFQRIRLSGDFRLRYEGDFFDSNNGDFLNPANPTQILNSTTDRSLFRIRARLDVDAKLADGVEVGLGLATGTNSNPVSTNVTLGDSFNKKTIQFDKAYLKWSPDSALTFWGGRFPNPWFFTDLVWDRDLNFDGIAVQYKPRLSDSWSLFCAAGAFPLQEVELSTRDKWLFGGQLGAQYRRTDSLTLKLAAAFYDFEHTVGIMNDPAQPGATDWTAPQFQQKGNTLMAINTDPSAPKFAYASAFRELNITGSLDLGYWDPIHVIFTADYVNNLGFDQQAVSLRAGSNVPKETEGYQLGVTVGYPTITDFGDWKGLLFYKYLESDAVMDAFTDSDFHLGGTNAKGWIIGGDLGLTKNVWLSTRWYTANEISRSQLAIDPNNSKLAIDVFQFDLNARF